MINEYATLGKKSLCHYMTGRLDLLVPVSLRVWMGVRSARGLRTGWLPISVCTAALPQWGSGAGASSLGFLVPSNPSAEGESSARGAGHKASVIVKLNMLVQRGVLGVYKSRPVPFHHTENHYSLHSNSHWETSLCHDMGLPQNSICYLKSVLWSVQWGCFSLNSKQIANVFSCRSPTVPTLLNLKWFFAELVRLQQSS